MFYAIRGWSDGYDSILFSHMDSSVISLFPSDSTISMTPEMFAILDTVAASVLIKYIINDPSDGNTTVYFYQYLGLQSNFMLTILAKAAINNDQVLFNRLQTLLTKYENQWNFKL